MWKRAVFFTFLCYIKDKKCIYFTSRAGDDDVSDPEGQIIYPYTGQLLPNRQVTEHNMEWYHAQNCVLKFSLYTQIRDLETFLSDNDVSSVCPWMRRSGNYGDMSGGCDVFPVTCPGENSSTCSCQ